MSIEAGRLLSEVSLWSVVRLVFVNFAKQCTRLSGGWWRDKANFKKCFSFCNCCSSNTRCATYTITLTRNHQRLCCNSCLILHNVKLNQCGQVKPTKFERQFQSTITNLDLPTMCYKIVICGITDGRRCEYYFLTSFLHEGELKVRMYGENFNSSRFQSIIPTGCLGITRLRSDRCKL